MSNVTSGMVINALEQKPTLLSEVCRELVDRGHITIPATPPPKPLAVEFPYPTFNLTDPVELYAAKLPDLFPTGNYVVTLHGSPGGCRFKVEASDDGVKASVSMSKIRDDVMAGVVRFESPSNRAIHLRIHPAIEGVPFTAYPDGLVVSVQWVPAIE